MAITIEAIYEDGVLKPEQRLPFNERERVRVTVDRSPLDLVQAYGLMDWKGDAETLERIALDPDFLPEEPA
jgi:predicted DNA-binding antitoxin AbrB/MazE fold protein